MSFGDDVARFELHAKGLTTTVLQAAAVEVHNSLTVGSAVTGSQGTPVDTGFAINSWSVEGVSGPGGASTVLATMQPGEVKTITGGAIYLRGLEEGRARRKPAGWVRLTAAMWPRIVAWANQRAAGLRPNAAVPGGASLRRREIGESRKKSGRSSSRRRW